MFTASTFSLIRRNCPEELDKLLRLLDIKIDWKHGDEFEIAQELDSKIEKEICALLKSDSDLTGYAKLLDIGGVEYSISETRKERLAKIIANRDRILSASSGCAHDLYNIAVTCNHAESLTDKFKSSLETKSIAPLIKSKEEIALSRKAKQAIKDILAKELDLSDCDQIVISIFGKKYPSPKKISSTFKPNAETFEVLEQLNEILKKI